MLPLKNKTILENAVGCFFTFSKAMFLSKFDEFKQTDGKLPWMCCCEVPKIRSSSQREAFGKGAQGSSAGQICSFSVVLRVTWLSAQIPVVLWAQVCTGNG